MAWSHCTKRTRPSCSATWCCTRTSHRYGYSTRARGKTKKAYLWGYARGEFGALPGVVYEFCAGRGAKYPMEFLKGWNGTLICDDYKAYEAVFKIGQRIEAGCRTHAPIGGRVAQLVGGVC